MPNIPQRFKPLPALGPSLPRTPVAPAPAPPVVVSKPKDVPVKEGNAKKPRHRGYDKMLETVSINDWDVNPFRVADDLGVILPNND